MKKWKQAEDGNLRRYSSSFAIARFLFSDNNQAGIVFPIDKL